MEHNGVSALRMSIIISFVPEAEVSQYMAVRLLEVIAAAVNYGSAVCESMKS